MEMVGQTIECPTCKMETYLFVPPDQKEKMVQSHPGLADTRNRYYILAGFAVFAVILGVAIHRHFAEQIKESNNFNAEFSDNHPFENAAIAMTNEWAAEARLDEASNEDQRALEKINQEKEEAANDANIQEEIEASDPDAADFYVFCKKELEGANDTMPIEDALTQKVDEDYQAKIDAADDAREINDLEEARDREKLDVVTIALDVAREKQDQSSQQEQVAQENLNKFYADPVGYSNAHTNSTQ